MIGEERCEAAAGMAQLALECGFEPGRDPVRQVLVALGFDPSIADPEKVIRGRLDERHERRLAACIDAAE